MNMFYEYKDITNYLHFTKNPVRFGSVVTKKYEFLLGMSFKSLPSKFVYSIYIYYYVNHSKGTWNSVFVV